MIPTKVLTVFLLSSIIYLSPNHALAEWKAVAMTKTSVLDINSCEYRIAVAEPIAPVQGVARRTTYLFPESIISYQDQDSKVLTFSNISRYLSNFQFADALITEDLNEYELLSSDEGSKPFNVTLDIELPLFGNDTTFHISYEHYDPVRGFPFNMTKGIRLKKTSVRLEEKCEKVITDFSAPILGITSELNSLTEGVKKQTKDIAELNTDSSQNKAQIKKLTLAVSKNSSLLDDKVKALLESLNRLEQSLKDELKSRIKKLRLKLGR